MLITVEYDELNHAINQYEGKAYFGKEAPHPDLPIALDYLAEEVMDVLGFPSKKEDWKDFKLSTVSFSGVQVRCNVHFHVINEGEINVSLPQTNSVPASVVEGVIEEVISYLSGEKRQQGNLFSDKETKGNVAPEEEKEPEAEPA